MLRARTRLVGLVAAALASGIVLIGAAPAQARTWDHDPVRETIRFSVAGKPWTLRDVSVGRAKRTIHVGQHSGTVWNDYRLTFRDASGRADRVVERHLYRQAFVVGVFTDASFPTVRAFRAAQHRALTVDPVAAKARYLADLRIESVSADLETNIARTIDHLQSLPPGAAPDFSAVETVRSDEYRGSVTVSGSDRTHWSVIVRDTRDGFGAFYDAATGSSATFRL